MDEKFSSVLSVAVIPQIIALITEKEKKDEITAINEFYRSETYALLSKEETKMWYYSPMTVYLVWKRENETGELVLPED